MHTPFIRQQCYMDCHNILQNGEGEKRMKQQPPPQEQDPLSARLNTRLLQY